MMEALVCHPLGRCPFLCLVRQIPAGSLTRDDAQTQSRCACSCPGVQGNQVRRSAGS